MHLEMIKSKQVGVKEAVSKIIKAIPEKMCGMELKFMLEMRHDIDSM